VSHLARIPSILIENKKKKENDETGSVVPRGLTIFDALLRENRGEKGKKDRGPICSPIKRRPLLFGFSGEKRGPLKKKKKKERGGWREILYGARDSLPYLVLREKKKEKKKKGENEEKGDARAQTSFPSWLNRRSARRKEKKKKKKGEKREKEAEPGHRRGSKDQ